MFVWSDVEKTGKVRIKLAWLNSFINVTRPCLKHRFTYNYLNSIIQVVSDTRVIQGFRIFLLRYGTDNRKNILSEGTLLAHSSHAVSLKIDIKNIYDHKSICPEIECIVIATLVTPGWRGLYLFDLKVTNKGHAFALFESSILWGAPFIFFPQVSDLT